MASLNDLLVNYGPTTNVTANKIALFEDLGGDQDTVYAQLLAGAGLDRDDASFNDALHQWLSSPLHLFSWKAAFWAGDPLWTPPADGGATAAWRNGGTTRSEGAYLDPTDGLVLPGVAGNYASTPDAAALDITGDITIMARITLTDWTPASASTILSKSQIASTAYSFSIGTDGKLSLATSADGTTVLVGTSTVAAPGVAGEPLSVAVTLDVDNGASGRDYRFWTSTDGVTWTQLGSTVTSAGATSIVANAIQLEVGSAWGGVLTPFDGNVASAAVYSGSAFTTAGAGGTRVFGVDFTGRSDVNKFVCSTGQTVTINNSLDARQATGTKQPAYRASVAALNDQPAVQGDGVDDFLQTVAWSSALSQPRSRVIVGSLSAASKILGDGIVVGSRSLVGRNGTTAWEVNSGTSLTGGTADTATHLFVAVSNGASSTLYVDGVSTATGNAGAHTATGATIAANYNGTSGFNNGYTAFDGQFAGDITAEANWPAFVAWVETTYGIAVA